MHNSITNRFFFLSLLAWLLVDLYTNTDSYFTVLTLLNFYSYIYMVFFLERIFPEQSHVVIVAWDFFFYHLLYLCANSLCLHQYVENSPKNYFMIFLLHFKERKIMTVLENCESWRIFFMLICPKLKITFQSSIRSSSLIN